MNVLFVASEVFPLIKTGGLADVAGSLPIALQRRGEEVRVLLPAYHGIIDSLKGAKVVATTRHYDLDIKIWQARIPGSQVLALMVDCPLFDRPGHPYLGADGHEWPDNALRFALFCQVAVDVALNRLAFDWPVDLVHCNDWQSGMVPALLQLFPERPATLFTIHNLAYQGLFPKQTYFDLGLPGELWHMYGVEFHDRFSFIKGGLSYADAISTVSPRYALEIRDAEFAYGLEGLLQHRADRLFGILNGIDTTVWNPGTDENLVQKYNRRSLGRKLVNKTALQQEYGLPQRSDVAMIGFISRLVEQKGLDLILDAMPAMLELSLQLVFLGAGEEKYELALARLADEYPEQVGVQLGYDEPHSHRIEAGADLFLMPSLFEPCGLNQMYSLRYGTLPVVNAVGGLADSVTDYQATDSGEVVGNGFVMQQPTAAALVEAVQRAFVAHQDPALWRGLQLNAMTVDNSWSQRADDYIELYQRCVSDYRPSA